MSCTPQATELLSARFQENNLCVQKNFFPTINRRQFRSRSIYDKFENRLIRRVGGSTIFGKVKI